jgi:hypothetical protein
MAKTITADLFWQPVGEIAYLLQSMADQLWEAADAAGVDSPLHSLGLGSFLAAAQATNMLPVDGDVPNHAASELSDPLQMLEAVEQLTRQLDPHLEGARDLNLAVTDLVREAHHRAV